MMFLGLIFGALVMGWLIGLIITLVPRPKPPMYWRRPGE